MFASVHIAGLVFARPGWLVALVAALLPTVACLRARRGGRRTGWVSVGVQSLALILLAFALARPAARGGADRPWLILRDASASMRGSAALTGWPEEMPADELLFAAGTAARPDDLDPDATRPASALRYAAAEADRRGGAVFFSDGQFTDTEGLSAAGAALRAAGVPVLIVPQRNAPPDARLSGLAVRARGRGAELVAAAAANTVLRRTLRLRAGGQLLVERELSLLPGVPATVRVPLPADVWDRVCTAELTPRDAFPENDRARTVRLPAERKLLVASRTRPGWASDAAWKRPEALPADSLAWLAYDAAVVVDPTGDMLSAPQRRSLAAMVRAGGGLVLIGSGPRRGPADLRDPLNRIAALVPRPYARRPMRLAVVLDASGSMGRRGSRGRAFDLASEGVLSLRNHLTEADSLAVVTFAGEAETVYDSGAGAPDFPALARALERVNTAGPTRVLPALKRAAELDEPDRPLKLVLVLSDLATEPPNSEAVAEVAGALKTGGWQLAAVAVGTASPQETALTGVVDALDAPLEVRPDLAGVAKVFARLLRRVRGDAIERGRWMLTVPAGVLGLAEPIRLPADARLVAGPRDRAEVLASLAGAPVVGVAPGGAGRVVSVALPVGEGLNADLLASPAMGRLVAAAVEGVAPQTAPGVFALETDRRDGSLQLRLRARRDDRPLNFLDPIARLQRPGGEPGAPTPLRQVGPGQYAGTIAAVGPGGAVRVRAGGRLLIRRLALEDYPEEFRRTGADEESLARLAALTGGELVEADALTAAVREARSRGREPLGHWFILAALAAVLFDWAVARVRRGG